MHPYLTNDDVQRLMKEPSPQVRTEIAGKLAQEVDNLTLSENETAIANDVLRVLARDIETSVRHSLAQNLRRAQKIPHDVALLLAHDVEAVAMPILESSPVLTDEDLVSIIKDGSPEKHEAIAVRPHVSEKVSDAIITNAGETAVSKLMQNDTARISETSLNKAISRFEESESVKESIIHREVLPVTVAERLTTLVSEHLKNYLVANHDLSPSMAADLVLQSRERTIINLSMGGEEEDTEKLVAQMHRHQRLSPSIVLRALCTGDLAFFESALAIMAGVPVVNARILIHDAGQLGLKTLYEKAGLPPGMLPIVRTALGILNEIELDDSSVSGLNTYRARVIERILTQFEHLPSEDIEYLVAKLGDVLTPPSAA